MTTTGGAKYKSMLQRVETKVMIVEEAAEILESHLTTGLSPSTQHLILIGDHKQLRPGINSFETKKLNLDLSMFERLINNGFENVMLDV